MRKVLLHLTTSLDGYIADIGGGVDWLALPPQEPPPEYSELMDEVDTLIMGRATYETSLKLGALPDGNSGGSGNAASDVFAGRRTYVFTSRDDLPAAPGVTLVHERAQDFTSKLKGEAGGTIWLFGGGLLATSLLKAGLIDDFLIILQPVLLGDGIPLWRTPFPATRLELVSARPWPEGLVELRYRLASSG